MGYKPRRKNHFKKRTSRKPIKIGQAAIPFFKITAGIALLAATSFLFIFVYDFLTQWNFFRAEKLTVSGANRLSPDRVIEHSQLHTGINTLSVNLPLVKKKLLTHPWIAEAEVSRRLPHAIHIKITEHKPLAILDFGRKFLMNAEGKIFKEMGPSDPDNLPSIDGLDLSDINIAGNLRAGSFQAVMDVLTLGQRLESVLPNKYIKRIQVDKEIGLTLYVFDGGQQIKLGYEEYPKKYERLKKIILYLKEGHGFSGFNSIDLGNLDRILVNPVRIESPVRDHKEV